MKQKELFQNILIAVNFLGLIIVIIFLLQSSNRAVAGQAVASNIATSCNGDSVCEMTRVVSTTAGSGNRLLLTSDTKAVDVSGSLTVNGPLSILGMRITKNSTSFNVRTIENASVADTLRIKPLLIANGIQAEHLDVNGKDIVMVNMGTAPSYAESSNSFVCIDQTGRLFKSTTPCQ